MTLILNGGALPTLNRYRATHRGGAHLGRLVRPREISRLRESLDAGYAVGVDCDGFSGWNVDRYTRMIGLIERELWGRPLTMVERVTASCKVDPAAWAGAGQPAPVGVTPPPAPHPNLRFVVVPDVPFDAAATARLWSTWAPLMSHLPLALCVQDGATATGIPWGWPGLACLFMAGSTDYKLSAPMAEICQEGKRRGLWIHAGRVNTPGRLQHMLACGWVDSVDGSAFDLFRDTHLPWALDMCAGHDPGASTQPAVQGLLDLPLAAS